MIDTVDLTFKQIRTVAKHHSKVIKLK